MNIAPAAHLRRSWCQAQFVLPLHSHQRLALARTNVFWISCFFHSDQKETLTVRVWIDTSHSKLQEIRFGVYGCCLNRQVVYANPHH